jgi:hypothetical protein
LRLGIASLLIFSLRQSGSYQLHELRGNHFDVVSSLRQHGTLRFLVIDFSPCGRKIDNSKDGSYRSAED